jgi:uncharacterized protein YfbU (UPF0304 family)
MGLQSAYRGIPFEKEDSPQEVNETGDILEMWSFLESSYAELRPENKIKVEREVEPLGVQFMGFDGNHEPHYNIACYMIKDLGRFEDFKNRDINSHCPMLESYKRMYREFKPLQATVGVRHFNADEVIGILNARRDPGS